MIDAIKKTLLAGVGAAVVTKDKVQEALDDFVKQGKVKAEDARVIADKIAEQGRREFEEVSEKLATKVKDVFDRSAHDNTARLATLEERVKVLEAKLAEPPTRSGEP